jgi:phage tail sheath protein FI
MAMEFIVPGMQIDEADVGTRPTQQLSLAGIGIVGTFQKGPVNTPTTIGDAVQFAKVFGGVKAGLTGPKSVKGCFAQGANDLRIVRIVGAGAKASSVVLKDADGADSVMVTANTPGLWGDELKIISLAAGGNSFDMAVSDGYTTDSFRELTLAKLPVKKELVTVTVVREAKKLPAAVTKVPLTGGSDGADVSTNDYIGTITAEGKRSGLKALEPVQCGLALCAQQYGDSIWQALISWAENCDIDEGLRIPILNSAPNLGVDAACVQTKTLDTTDGRGIFIYPWVTPEDEENDDVFVAPDGYYAGRLATLNPCQSPSNKAIYGIRKLERDFTYAEVKAVTLARISPITLVNGRGYRIRNGVTLSSDAAWCQTNIRRQQDKMEMEIYNAIQWAISEPHNKTTWNAIATQCDAYLRIQLSSGFIYGYLPTLCNEQTNPSENIISRILTFILRWKPLYAADYIVMEVKRELPASDSTK